MAEPLDDTYPGSIDEKLTLLKEDLKALMVWCTENEDYKQASEFLAVIVQLDEAQRSIKGRDDLQWTLVVEKDEP